MKTILLTDDQYEQLVAALQAAQANIMWHCIVTPGNDVAAVVARVHAALQHPAPPSLEDRTIGRWPPHLETK